MEGEEKKELAERGEGNEKSLQIVLKGKDTVTRKMNMSNVRTLSARDPKQTQQAVEREPGS